MEEEKPYWMNLTGGTTFSGMLRFKLENYFPEAHYRKSLKELEGDEEVVLDGGKSNLHTDGRRNTVYYWLNPDTGAALYHTEVNGEEADPFFGSTTEAEDYLDTRSNSNTQEMYEGFSLYKARVEKIEDAVEVLTSQSGIQDF
ncbi:hypothetical protein GRX01_01685 [Halobaculum sp. WSA2]|uniref:Uncharacterized protein n=1 Tax=Halobaculum saliterrae TaxID=2073113 RepID=A0A6B0SV35_9EURY|nr:hypothetical protein [Halobaculum saliterrae]MXR40072.1 hypothetical protein [Halobaculum saliterrae]